MSGGGYLLGIRLRRDKIASFKRYPFSIPAVRDLDKVDFHPAVTYFVGENGSGKSTLVEAIAKQAGFSAEGGTKDLHFSTRDTESELWDHILLNRDRSWGKREYDGFFLRAESLYNVASALEDLQKEGGGDTFRYYGGRSLHAQSHGEAFLAIASGRFSGDGVYILDEPESALSPQRQLSLLKIIHQLVTKEHSQFIIATHSPIILAYPDSLIYRLSEDGIETVAYEDTDHYRITRDFLNARESFLRHLLD